MVDILSFNGQGVCVCGGGLAQFGPIRTERKRGEERGVQKLYIFHGFYKCMVPYWVFENS